MIFLCYSKANADNAPGWQTRTGARRPRRRRRLSVHPCAVFPSTHDHVYLLSYVRIHSFVVVAAAAVSSSRRGGNSAGCWYCSSTPPIHTRSSQKFILILCDRTLFSNLIFVKRGCVPNSTSVILSRNYKYALLPMIHSFWKDLK